MATVSGTSGSDFITKNTSPKKTTDSADKVYAKEGNDWISGAGGNDTIYGEEGDDWLYGQGGNDLIFGGVGKDRINGDSGNDRIYAQNGNDTVFGGIGNDIIHGERGNDIIYGENGNDRIAGADWYDQHGKGEVDTLTGGFGRDSFYLGTSTQNHYIGNRNRDYALITDFQLSQDEILVRKAAPNQYRLTYRFGDTGIVDVPSGDLIGIVENVNPWNLEVSQGNSYTVIDQRDVTLF